MYEKSPDFMSGDFFVLHIMLSDYPALDYPALDPVSE